jgi:membrane protein YdbS with pleckstrin-like domain
MASIVRLLLIAAAVVTGWFVAKDAPDFGVIQGMVVLVLVVIAIGVLAIWSAAWRRASRRNDRKPNP